MPGYIYLIMMADGVYKIGMTAQTIGPSIKRLGAYPGDSRTVYVRWCEGDVSDMERRLIWEFRRRFGKHQRGNEYFVGPEETMIDIITTFFTDPEHKKSVTCSLEQFLNSEFVNKGDDLWGNSLRCHNHSRQYNRQMFRKGILLFQLSSPIYQVKSKHQQYCLLFRKSL